MVHAVAFQWIKFPSLVYQCSNKIQLIKIVLKNTFIQFINVNGCEDIGLVTFLDHNQLTVIARLLFNK
jgi:hypothetical protein